MVGDATSSQIFTDFAVARARRGLYPKYSGRSRSTNARLDEACLLRRLRRRAERGEEDGSAGGGLGGPTEVSAAGDWEELQRCQRRQIGRSFRGGGGGLGGAPEVARFALSSQRPEPRRPCRPPPHTCRFGSGMFHLELLLIPILTNDLESHSFVY